VSRAMLHRMLAQLADPVTAKPLGRLPSVGARAPVAAFDLTFSPSKSVWLMWAMADQATRTAVEEVLANVASEVISWAEDHVFSTRTGAQGARQGPVRGVVASAWLHYESREGDAQLHHHLVVLNRAQAVSDGAWRTLDSRALHPLVVALSERHVGIVEDLMTERFGVAWAETRAIAGRVAKREVDGVAADLVAEFSRRTKAIEEAIAEKSAAMEAERGRVLTSWAAPPSQLLWGGSILQAPGARRGEADLYPTSCASEATMGSGGSHRGAVPVVSGSLKCIATEVFCSVPIETPNGPRGEMLARRGPTR